MIRFAWLQARTQTAIAFAGLALVAIIVALTGPHLVHLYDANVATCAAHGDCSTATDAFLRNDKTLGVWLGILVIAIPGLIGLFWGAPLIARELESGTYRLAWTQSVTRTRWLVIKVAVVGVAAMVVAGLLSLMVTWWASPIDTASANRFSMPLFDERGIVVIGYAAFAVALGVAVGLLIRRTVPAMATTLAAFVVVRVATIFWIRRRYIAPLHRVSALDPQTIGLRTGNLGFSLLPPTPNIPNAWIYSTHFADKSGQPLAHSVVARLCPHLGGALGGPPPSGSVTKAPRHLDSVLHDCVAKVAFRYHTVTTYQPASHYWTFQWIELGVFLGAALILSAFCIWWIRRGLA
ncbi:MAG TPA: ABC transporter permease subunit [Actinomycetota bacterium]|nr:ABC transporter permease subunit [Actinomycetota bacterium]